MEHEVTVKFTIEAKDFKDAVEQISDITWRIDDPKSIDIEPMPLDNIKKQD